MTPNWKIFLRTIAGINFSGIFGHQYYAIDHSVGIHIPTIFFLITLLCFYSFVFVYRFYRPQVPFDLTSDSFDAICHKTQIALAAFNILLTLYPVMFKAEPITAQEIAILFVECIFILFPEHVIKIIERFFPK